MKNDKGVKRSVGPVLCWALSAGACLVSLWAQPLSIQLQFEAPKLFQTSLLNEGLSTSGLDVRDGKNRPVRQGQALRQLQELFAQSAFRLLAKDDLKILAFARKALQQILTPWSETWSPLWQNLQVQTYGALHALKSIVLETASLPGGWTLPEGTSFAVQCWSPLLSTPSSFKPFNLPLRC